MKKIRWKKVLGGVLVGIPLMFAFVIVASFIGSDSLLMSVLILVVMAFIGIALIVGDI